MADIADRLRPLCEGWPEESFTEMVRGLAAVTLKYDGHATAGAFDRRSTDRLVSELKDALERSMRSRVKDPPKPPPSARGGE